MTRSTTIQTITQAISDAGLGDDRADAACAIVSALRVAGLRVVPREPTSAMLYAYKGALKALIGAMPQEWKDGHRGNPGGFKLHWKIVAKARWRDMIDAEERAK